MGVAKLGGGHELRPLSCVDVTVLGCRWLPSSLLGAKTRAQRLEQVECCMHNGACKPQAHHHCARDKEEDARLMMAITA